jgi:hypothetical protein
VETAKRRMEPCTVIAAVDKFRDVGTEMIQVAVSVRVDFLPLQSLHETLAAGVVVRIRRPTHAGDHAVFLQHRNVNAGCVLDATVGMMHNPGWRRPFRDRPLQRRQRFIRLARLRYTSRS